MPGITGVRCWHAARSRFPAKFNEMDFVPGLSAAGSIGTENLPSEVVLTEPITFVPSSPAAAIVIDSFLVVADTWPSTWRRHAKLRTTTVHFNRNFGALGRGNRWGEQLSHNW